MTSFSDQDNFERDALMLDKLLSHSRESVLNDYELKLEQAQIAGEKANELILAECENPGEYFETLEDLYSHEYRNEQPFILKNKS